MKLKSILTCGALLCALTFAFTEASFAQDATKCDKAQKQCSCDCSGKDRHECKKFGKKGMKGHAGSPTHLYKELNLTEEQKVKADAIFKTSRDRADKIVTPAQRKQMEELRENSMKEFRTILTPEQAKKLDDKREQMKNFREKHKGEFKNRKTD